MELLIEINAYHWFALGLVLFAAEALGAAGFLLGAAAAAIVIGVLSLFAPDLAIAAQFSLYALVALVATGLYLKVFRTEQAEDTSSSLNHRAAGLIGHEFDLDQGLSTGTNKVQIGDTLWRVQTDAAIAPGTRVKVVDADDMSLQLASLK
jgi:membrane protein implicated in regulation of membrane protease activity